MPAKASARKRDDVTAAQERDDDTLPKKKGPGSPARFKGVKRGPGRGLKVRDLTRNLTNAMKVVKVVAKLGGDAHVEVMPDGRIRIIPAGQAPATPADKNSWDEVYAANEDRPA
jgi:hypothetical protein